jgi:hypothetical protein
MTEDKPVLITVEHINILEKKLKHLIYVAINNGQTLDEIILLILKHTDNFEECAVACFFAGRISTEFDLPNE